MHAKITALLGINPKYSSDFDKQGTECVERTYNLGTSGYKFIVISYYNPIHHTEPRHNISIMFSHPNISYDIEVDTRYNVHDFDAVETSIAMLRMFYRQQQRQHSDLTDLLSKL